MRGLKAANVFCQAGLVHNRKIFAIAVFASLGGLCVHMRL
jgi:hypothetical protein